MHVEAHAELSSETRHLSTSTKPLVRHQHPFCALDTLNRVFFPNQTHLGVGKEGTFDDSASSYILFPFFAGST